jgi:hypothetical protein
MDVSHTVTHCYDISQIRYFDHRMIGMIYNTLLFLAWALFWFIWGLGLALFWELMLRLHCGIMRWLRVSFPSADRIQMLETLEENDQPTDRTNVIKFPGRR